MQGALCNHVLLDCFSKDEFHIHDTVSSQLKHYIQEILFKDLGTIHNILTHYEESTIEG